jgi:hypothetical protein
VFFLKDIKQTCKQHLALALAFLTSKELKALFWGAGLSTSMATLSEAQDMAQSQTGDSPHELATSSVSCGALLRTRVQHSVRF